MKAISFTLFLFFITVYASVQAQTPYNFNLETLDQKGNPFGWDLTYNNLNVYEVKVDSLVKKQGKYAVSISSEKSEAKSSAIMFPINKSFKGKSLIFIGYLKTANVREGFAGLWLRVEGRDGKELAFESMESQGLKGTNDWKEYMIQVPYDDEQAVSIKLGSLLVGKGKVWVDSMRLYLDEQLISEAPEQSLPEYAALKDTTFAKSSGLADIPFTGHNVRHLSLLGELWGFLKYHHPAIAKGDYNWDAELFRILPAVLSSKTNEQFAEVLERWVDGLGKPPVCVDCKPLTPLEKVAMQPDYGHLFNNAVFSKELTNKLEYLLANSNNTRHYYISMHEGTQNPRFKNEDLYPGHKYPDVGYRLLAVYRYWNMIQYFSPNRKLITEDWNEVLPDFITEVLMARDQKAYLQTMVRMISTTHDTHTFIRSDGMDAYLGAYRLPFQATFIGEQLVVTGYYKDTLGVKANVKPGDVIRSINGQQVTALIEKYYPVTPASNRAAVLRDMPGMYLLRSPQSLFKIGLARNGKAVLVNQQAVKVSSLDTHTLDWNPDPNKKAYRLIDGDIGYIACEKYKTKDLDSLKNLFKNTKGLVVDMRNYPIDEMVHTLGNYLKADSSAFVKFTAGSVSKPGLFTYGADVLNGKHNSDAYKGKVIVIVNERTQSNAEFVTMALQTSPNVTVIGGTTAGADGNISEIPLPGDITTWISGLGVYYPDGTNAQRAGVKLDITLQPTIKGVKMGADELLEKAKQLIKAHKI